VHFLTLAVAFTYASGWDSACEILYREENLTGDPAAAREGERSYYVDPGFTCEYLVNGEWIMLRRDMTGTRNTVFVITAAAALIAVTGVFIHNLKARDPGWDCAAHYKRFLATEDPQPELPIRVATGEGRLNNGYLEIPVPAHLRRLMAGASWVGEHRLVMALISDVPSGETR